MAALETTETEWGVLDRTRGDVTNHGSGRGSETALSVTHARRDRLGQDVALARRIVTYGPWEEVQDA